MLSGSIVSVPSKAAVVTGTVWRRLPRWVIRASMCISQRRFWLLSIRRWRRTPSRDALAKPCRTRSAFGTTVIFPTEILTGATIPYLEDSAGFISVMAPDGAVLTPGAPNILRNVYWRLLDQNKEVAEADGSVTLRIERTGDIANESLTVTYSTLRFWKCRRRHRLHRRDRYRHVRPRRIVHRYHDRHQRSRRIVGRV